MSVGGRLSREDVEVLRSFARLADRLAKRRLWREGSRELSVTTRYWKDEEGQWWETQEATFPDEELVRSALLDIRMVYAHKERANFKRVCDLLRQKVKSVEKEVDALRAQYDQALRKFDVIEIHGVEGCKTPEDAFNLWLNAHYFHGDPKKRAVLDQLENALGVEFKFVFLSVAFGIAECAIALGGVVSSVLREEGVIVGAPSAGASCSP
ncbi:MAG: hypothetical protein AB1609_13755 [Bacillota bacterium]